MITILRHLLSIALLPLVMVVIIPSALRRGNDTRWLWSDGALPAIGAGAGGLLILAGFGLFAWCVALFARVGNGTLAPWDPARRLVVVGPYRHVRNPMISGVVMLLLGQALFYGSRATGIWAVIFLAVNHAYFLLLEEPGLERRFGESYRVYKRQVPRWVPRLGAWQVEE